MFASVFRTASELSRPSCARTFIFCLVTLGLLILAGLGPGPFPVHAAGPALWPTSSESSSATATLEGQVLDPSGQSVAHALVEVLSRDGSLRRTTSSDEQGRFSLLLRPGRHLLRVRSGAFAPSLTVLTLTPGEERTLEVGLQLAALDEQVVVVASGAPQEAARSAKSVTVLDRARLEAQGEFTLVDALQLAPSMRIARLGGPGAFTTVKTRGLRDQDTAFLVDGLPFHDASALEGDATPLLEDFLLLNLDRIEILRGSGSSLHGSNAMAGVVNLVSDDGGGDLRGLVEVQGGGLGLAHGRTRIAGGSHDGAFSFSAAAAHLNVSDGVDGNDALRKTLLQGVASWSPGPGRRLRGSLLFGDTFSLLNDSSFAVPEENLPVTGVVEARPLDESQVERLLAGQQLDFGTATFVPDLDDPDNQRASRFLNGILQWEHRLGGRFGYSLSYSFLGSGRQFRDGPGGKRFEPDSNTLSDLDGRIHLLRAQADYRLGARHSLSAGYEFQRETFISTDTAAGVFARSEASQDAHSFFVQDQMHFFEERLQIS
ncbi:MAG TPA: TonB-dependent receptor, partial [Acidobacteriota bacterium]|nr:TonB-dependent receptor [Acidobacteriota bacterium]